MKKVFRSLLVMAAAAVAMTACVKEMDVENVASEGSGIFVGITAQTVDTKTAFGAKEGALTPVLWQSGDQITVSVNPTASKGGVACPVTPRADFKTAEFTYEIPAAVTAGPYAFYAISPSADFVSASSNSSGEYVQYQIPSVQTPWSSWV